MTQLIKSVLVLLAASVSLIQAQAPGKPSPSPSPKPPPPPCLIKDIRQMDVSGCTCEPHSSKCDKTGCMTCKANIENRHTKHCAVGCTDDDKECQGCGLWFSTLCNCLKYQDCKHTGTITPHGDSIFVLTNNGEQLITTTDLLPGILEARNATRYEPGWRFAQEHYNRANQALALNSVRSRTHEQFHIHVCNRPNSTDPRILDILDNIPKSQHIYGKDLKKVGNHDDLYCRTIEKGQTPIVYDFVTAIDAILDDKTLNEVGKICHGFAGAGIIQDSHGNVWACVTGNREGPLFRFCEGQK
ncbi:uncharacterized protein TRIVIDRAFT_63787 [Trichoderma virens Gv29-8]|uniref:CDP-diacylglycerol phosphatidylhydrolase n=1 Tax=Hypocrea virens (strain Gv29-8 / FGSC 10586) TaxID=413071 RepID=G9MG36_HYPVG|nr:uncharacterized protein TRIVIDRAFT_63787 [Trichoderma virens Gv29-8]EHK26486.1 hypothetical protein TRIVIDRAFT_63787 [Trichoderma virens Gv29-8]